MRLNTFLTDVTGYADDEHPAAALAAVLKKKGWQGKRVAIDQSGWFLTINLYNRLIAEFGPLLDAPALVEPLRRTNRNPKWSRWIMPCSAPTMKYRRAFRDASRRERERYRIRDHGALRSRRAANMSAWSRSSPPALDRVFRTRPGAAASSSRRCAVLETAPATIAITLRSFRTDAIR